MAYAVGKLAGRRLWKAKMLVSELVCGEGNAQFLPTGNPGHAARVLRTPDTRQYEYGVWAGCLPIRYVVRSTRREAGGELQHIAVWVDAACGWW
jgi:hypothetical protein